MFIATITPDAAPSSVGAAWMVDVALPQGFGESDGASGHKHAAPTGLGGLGDAFGYKHAAPTGLGGLGGAFGYKHAAPTGLGGLGDAFGYKHAAPTGLGGLGGAFGYKHAAPTGLGGLSDALGYKHVAPTGLVRVVERAIKEAKPKQTCARRIGSEPRKRVVRKGTSRFHFVPVCGKPEQNGTLIGAQRSYLLSGWLLFLACLACLAGEIWGLAQQK